jgi:hypothetical protein
MIGSGSRFDGEMLQPGTMLDVFIRVEKVMLSSAKASPGSSWFYVLCVPTCSRCQDKRCAKCGLDHKN